MRLGDVGPDVTVLQENLNRLGFGVEVTSSYDEPTVAAVSQLQSARGAEPTGEADPQTLAEIAQLLAAQSDQAAPQEPAEPSAAPAGLSGLSDLFGGDAGRPATSDGLNSTDGLVMAGGIGMAGGSGLVDWLSLGLGLIQVAQGVEGSGNNGVSVQSGSGSYQVGSFPVEGTDIDRTVIVVRVSFLASPFVPPAEASISVVGAFSAGTVRTPPVLANVMLRCKEQSDDGWGTETHNNELIFTATPLEKPRGTAENPRLQFQCTLELKIPKLDNVLLDFKVNVNQLGLVDFEFFEPVFKTSTKAVLTHLPGGILDIFYDSAAHS